MAEDDEANGWGEYRKLVLHELQELRRRMDTDLSAHLASDERVSGQLQAALAEVSRGMFECQREIAVLKTKARLWGSLTGAAAGVMTALLSRMLDREAP